MAAGGGAIWMLGVDGILTRIDLLPASSEPGAQAPFVAPLVAGFLQARIAGSGAESYLSSEGLEAWTSEASSLPSLYSSPNQRYEAFEIVFVDDLGDGAYEVSIRMLGAHLDGEDEWYTEPLFAETLFVGPEEDLNGLQRPLVISGGRSGLSGP